MLGQRCFIIDFTKKDEVQQLFPSGPLLSSSKEKWNGIQFEYYQHPPYEIPENAPKQHLILINSEVPASTQYEQRIDGQFHKEQLREGEVIIIPAHTSHWARWDKEHRYIALSLDPLTLRRYVSELTDSHNVELVPHFAKSDPLIYGIGIALKQELESNEQSGRLYIDSLITTLCAHLIWHYTIQKQTTRKHSGSLSQYKLRQVIYYINNHLDQNLSLTELAAIAQMSPNYFATLFKQATGFAPHQYVIRCKVERAKELLLQGELSIAEVSYSLGFAHQSHLNYHFKRLVEVTPKDFLRNQ